MYEKIITKPQIVCNIKDCTFFLSANGMLYWCGRNHCNKPKHIETMKEMTSIHAYGNHFFFIDVAEKAYYINISKTLFSSLDFQKNIKEINLYMPIKSMVGNSKDVFFLIEEEGLVIKQEIKDGNSLKKPRVICRNIKEMYSKFAYHAFFVDKQDNVYAYGNNVYGQLGINSRNIKKLEKPQKINTLDKIKGKIKKIAVGYSHTMFHTDNGVYVCGSNDYGQLGFSHITDVHDPIMLRMSPSHIHFSNIFVGGHHSVVIPAREPFAYSCGKNNDGRTGVGNKNETIKNLTLVNLPLNKKIFDIITTRYATYYLFCDGSIWACGYDESGELGVGDKKNKYKPALVAPPHDDFLGIKAYLKGLLQSK